MSMFPSKSLQGVQAVSADKHDRRSEMQRCLIYEYLGNRYAIEGDSLGLDVDEARMEDRGELKGMFRTSEDRHIQ